MNCPFCHSSLVYRRFAVDSFGRSRVIYHCCTCEREWAWGQLPNLSSALGDVRDSTPNPDWTAQTTHPGGRVVPGGFVSERPVW